MASPVPPVRGAAEQREMLAALDARRRALRCSQAEVARLLGVSATTISRFFRGESAGLAGAAGAQRVELALRLFAHQRRQAPPRGAQEPEMEHGERLAPMKRRVRLETSAAAVARAHPAPPPDAAGAIYARPHRPLAGPEEEVAPREPRPVYHLLLAEDDADTIGLYQQVFGDDDAVRYEMTVVRSAGACLKRLREAASMGRPYDVLLMDLAIADARGELGEKGLLPRLRREPSLLPERVLVVSGISPYLLQRKRADLAALRAVFLPKPFDIEELAGVVRSLCRTGVAPAICLRFGDAAVRR
ncbi:MAG: helix-turn-helix domain-containing protein [Ktedonobacterales bacterium]